MRDLFFPAFFKLFILDLTYSNFDVHEIPLPRLENYPGFIIQKLGFFN